MVDGGYCCLLLGVGRTYLLLPTYFGLTRSEHRFSIFLILCGMEEYVLIPTRAENWRESDPWSFLYDLG